VRALQLCLAETSAFQSRFAEHRAAKIGLLKIDRNEAPFIAIRKDIETRFFKIASQENGLLQIGLPQVGMIEVRPSEIRPTQRRVLQVSMAKIVESSRASSKFAL
jgi:hypothetical protein